MQVHVEQKRKREDLNQAFNAIFEIMQFVA